jgi:hypothetical protein
MTYAALETWLLLALAQTSLYARNLDCWRKQAMALKTHVAIADVVTVCLRKAFA